MMLTGLLPRLTAIVLAVLWLTVASQARAVTFHVDSTGDEADANPGDGACATSNGACTLRAALTEADAAPATIELPAGTFTLNPGVTITGEASIIGVGRTSSIIEGSLGASSADCFPAASLTIRSLTLRGGALTGLGCSTDVFVDDANVGPNSGITVSGFFPSLYVTNSTIHGNTAGGIHATKAFVSITDSEIRDNSSPENGAGFYSQHSETVLQITNSAFRNNTSQQRGGAISARWAVIKESVIESNHAGIDGGGLWGGAEVETSTFRDNHAPTGGGGAIAVGMSSLRLIASTLTDNSARDGGAIMANSATIEITRSTLSGNRAAGFGGALFLHGDWSITSSTITENAADDDEDAEGSGGAIYAQRFGSKSLLRSIVANNTAGSGVSPDCGVEDDPFDPVPPIDSLGHNLIGNPTGCNIATEPTDLAGIQPMLGPLADNGGPTRTHALLPSLSPAIDAGGSCSELDQRGVPRPQGSSCDIGAYELACGNGTIDLFETCDDGNSTDGDCCSARCQLDADGTACSDSNACTSDDTCTAGSCTSGSPVECGACARCDAGSGCTANVLTGCHQPVERFSGQLTLSTTGKRLAWQWVKGEATTIGDFGSPFTGGRYAVCLFDESGSTPTVAFHARTRAGLCGTKLCWRTAGSSAFKYRNAARTPDGLESAELRSGPDGKAKILVSARGDELSLPTLPLSLPIRMQFQADNGQCWEASYYELGTTRNDRKQFKAKAFQP